MTNMASAIGWDVYLSQMDMLKAEGQKRLDEWKSPAFNQRVLQLRAQGDYIAAARECLVKVQEVIKALSNVASGWQRVYNAGHPAGNQVLQQHFRAMRCKSFFEELRSGFLDELPECRRLAM